MRVAILPLTVLILAACGVGAKAPLPPGTNDLGGGVTVIVHGIKDPVEPVGSASGGYPQPKPNDRWVAVELEVANHSTKMVSVPLTVAEMRTTGGVSAQPISLGDAAMPEPGWQVPAGASSRGWIAYEIPSTATPDMLLLDRRQGSIDAPVVVNL